MVTLINGIPSLLSTNMLGVDWAVGHTATTLGEDPGTIEVLRKTPKHGRKKKAPTRQVADKESSIKSSIVVGLLDNDIETTDDESPPAKSLEPTIAKALSDNGVETTDDESPPVKSPKPTIVKVVSDSDVETTDDESFYEGEDVGLSPAQSLAIDDAIIENEFFTVDETIRFTGQGGRYLCFHEEYQAMCDAKGVRINNKRFPLPASLQIDLCRHMYQNQLFFGNKIGRSDTALWPFFDMYNLRDSRKDEAARRFFADEIWKHAVKFTKEVKDDGGVSWRDDVMGARLPQYARGYEYIMNPKLSVDDWSGWRRKFSEVSTIKGCAQYGIDQKLYTIEELLDFIQYFTNALDEGQGAVAAPQSAVRPPSAPLRTGTTVKTRVSLSTKTCMSICSSAADSHHSSLHPN